MARTIKGMNVLGDVALGIAQGLRDRRAEEENTRRWDAQYGLQQEQNRRANEQAQMQREEFGQNQKVRNLQLKSEAFGLGSKFLLTGQIPQAQEIFKGLGMDNVQMDDPSNPQFVTYDYVDKAGKITNAKMPVGPLKVMAGFEKQLTQQDKLNMAMDVYKALAAKDPIAGAEYYNKAIKGFASYLPEIGEVKPVSENQYQIYMKDGTIATLNKTTGEVSTSTYPVSGKQDRRYIGIPSGGLLDTQTNRTIGGKPESPQRPIPVPEYGGLYDPNQGKMIVERRERPERPLPGNKYGYVDPNTMEPIPGTIPQSGAEGPKISDYKGGLTSILSLYAPPGKQNDFMVLLSAAESQGSLGDFFQNSDVRNAYDAVKQRADTGDMQAREHLARIHDYLDLMDKQLRPGMYGQQQGQGLQQRATPQGMTQGLVPQGKNEQGGTEYYYQR